VSEANESQTSYSVEQADIFQYQSYSHSDDHPDNIYISNMKNVLRIGLLMGSIKFTLLLDIKDHFVEQADIFQYQSYSHSDDIYIILKTTINTDTSIFVFSWEKLHDSKYASLKP
jgi:hypothetical protein